MSLFDYYRYSGIINAIRITNVAIIITTIKITMTLRDRI